MVWVPCRNLFSGFLITLPQIPVSALVLLSMPQEQCFHMNTLLLRRYLRVHR